MIQAELFVNLSEPNKLNKQLVTGPILTGALREESGVMEPVVLIESDEVVSYNYLYIPELRRYYFITDFISKRTRLWELYLKVDPLMSFRAELRSVPVILSASTQTGADEYLSGSGQWVARQRELTDILQFPFGLPQQGEFILITAGG